MLGYLPKYFKRFAADLSGERAVHLSTNAPGGFSSKEGSFDWLVDPQARHVREAWVENVTELVETNIIIGLYTSTTHLDVLAYLTALRTGMDTLVDSAKQALWKVL